MAVEDNPILMSEMIETVQKRNLRLIDRKKNGEEYNPGADAELGAEICRLKNRESGSNPNELLPGEGGIGTYKELRDAGEVGDNITPHHMPSAEYMLSKGISKNDGLCMNMEMPSPGTGGRHRMTDTYGRNMTDAQKAYYYSLSPRDALAYDIENLRQIYMSQGLYSEMRPRIQAYIKAYKEYMPELFNR